MGDVMRMTLNRKEKATMNYSMRNCSLAWRSPSRRGNNRAPGPGGEHLPLQHLAAHRA